MRRNVDIREYAMYFCSLCGKTVDDEEEVIANTEFLPTP